MENSKSTGLRDANEIVISAIDVADFDASTIPEGAIVTINKNTREINSSGSFIVRSHAALSVNKATFIEVCQPEYLKRKLNGLYSLIEAALNLERFAKIDSYAMLERLINGVTDLSLTAYEAGKPQQYTSGKVRADKQEILWVDLNKWLSENEKRIDWRFPSPQSVNSKLEELSPSPITPSGGDALTPIIWEICEKLSMAGGRVTARYVMAELSAYGSPAILSKTAGGLIFETLTGDQKELTSEQLRARIKNWKKIQMPSS